jgi:glycosyltransferase involved in cell wall biosynthesis
VSFEVTKDACFVGLGTTSVMWYRIALPAMKLGADYVGLYEEPPDCLYATGIVKGLSQRPNFLDYKVVVVQQPRGPRWLKWIRELQSRGIKVVFEVDDWLHAIKNQKDHDFRDQFDNQALSDLEMCMKACDAMIVSTEHLRNAYRHFNRKIYVCENGVDVGRYDLKLPLRSEVMIGWAGATGHRNAVTPWLQAVARVMARRAHVRFVSIGQPFATAFHAHFPEERAIAVPFAAIEQYPAAMTMMDIALGPAAHTGFYRGKSDLRWLEAGALGVPIVAHPLVYPRIEDGVTGFHATTPQEIEKVLLKLVDDRGLRRIVGHNARSYVRRERAAEITSLRWKEVLAHVVEAGG